MQQFSRRRQHDIPGTAYLRSRSHSVTSLTELFSGHRSWKYDHTTGRSPAVLAVNMV